MSTRRYRDRSERGDTLVELLLAILVFSMISVAGMAAFAGLIRSSSTYQNVATFATALKNASTAVISQLENGSSSLYLPCATAAQYQVGGSNAISFANANLPTNFTAEVTQVQYWNGTMFSSTCATGSAQPQPEEISVTVTDTVTRVHQISSFIVGPADAALTVPATPYGLAASGPNNTTSFVESWTPTATNGSPVTDYILRYSPDGSTWTTSDVSSTVPSFSITMPTEATYYVEIAAVNVIGQGAWSAPDTVQWVTTTTTSTPVYGYTCPSGGTLNSVTNTCTSSSTYTAAVSYACLSTDLLSGTTCTPHSIYTATPSYSCPTGASESGTLCYGPATTAQGTTTGLSQISCPSAGNCVAIATPATYQPANVWTETNGTWGAPLAVASNLSSTYGTGLTAIMCTSVGNCVAVGYYFNSLNYQEPFAVSETNGTWGSGVSFNVPIMVNPGGQATAVACSSVGNCAVGGWLDNQGTYTGTFAFAITETNGVWATGTYAFTDSMNMKINGYYGSTVTSISCASASTCAFTGDVNASGASAPYVASETNGVWTAPVEVMTSGSGYYGGNATSINCTSAGNCVAVGNLQGDSAASLGYERPYVITETNGTWGTPAYLADTINNGNGNANAVTCTSAGNCVTGGIYVDIAGDSQAYVDSEVNGTWAPATGVAANLNIQGTNRGQAQVQAVNCTTVGNCAAGGYYANAGLIYEAFVITESNGTWAPAVEVAGALNNPVTNGFGGAATASISCADATSCVAVGSYVVSQVYSSYTHSYLSTFAGFVASSSPATVTQNCAPGDSLSGTTCTSTSYTAPTTPICNGGDTLTNSTTCTNTMVYAATGTNTYSYSCSSGSLSGTQCVTTTTTSATYGQVGSSPTYTYEVVGHNPPCYINALNQQICGAPVYGYVQTGSTPVYGYYCTSGSLSGTTCTTTTTTAATATQTGVLYSCNSGDTLSSTSVCTHTTTYSPTPSYSCNRGGSISGTSCVGSSGYTALATYSCPSGGALSSGTACTITTSGNASYVQTGTTSVTNYGFRG